MSKCCILHRGLCRVAANSQIYVIKRYAVKIITLDNQHSSDILFVLLLVQYDLKIFIISVATILIPGFSTGRQKGLQCLPAALYLHEDIAPSF